MTHEEAIKQYAQALRDQLDQDFADGYPQVLFEHLFEELQEKALAGPHPETADLDPLEHHVEEIWAEHVREALLQVIPDVAPWKEKEIPAP
ncbi:MAG TPA: hypothetical protein VJA25_00150 [Dehalococcoidia bacterium]|nr:hypothetical protein [Dehalococcoidia bacterium]